MQELRLGIVGCGAVANAHLPVVAETAGVETTALVDKNLERARAAAQAYGVARALDDHKQLDGLVDAAVVALPHHLHAPVAIDLLRQGIHVLVEKPMAVSVKECDEMIRVADESGAILAVGLLSRWLAVGRYVKRLLERDLLGRIESFEIREGLIYDWPAASDFTLRREMGGGVLADTGGHVLDVLLWWLGDWKDFIYRDDSRGGVEADCELELTLASGARGTVALSRLRDLGNSWILRGEHATLAVERKFDAKVELTLKGAERTLSGRLLAGEGAEEDPLDCFRLQLADFLDAVTKRREPLASGREGRRSVALIEACHAAREPLVTPWDAPATELSDRSVGETAS